MKTNAPAYSDPKPVVFPGFATALPISQVPPARSTGDGPSINDRVLAVFAALPMDVPFVQPKHIAPLLGLTENAFTKYCRNCSALKLWKGSYRFFTDDAGHMEILAAVIKLVLWSGRKLPGHLKLHLIQRPSHILIPP